MRNGRSLWIALLLASAGCWYGAPDEVLNGTAVYTQAAPTADFRPLNTYFLDTQVEVVRDGAVGTPIAMPSAVQAAIATNMAQLGYTAAALASAQTGVRATFASMTNTYYYGGSYCSAYWGWYGCYPYWGYAGSYNSGVVLMTIVDLRNNPPNPPTNPPPGQTIPVLWGSVMYGILSGTSSYDQARLVTAIDTSFQQSATVLRPQ